MVAHSHFHITNISTTDLLGLKIQFSTLLPPPHTCTVIRERGSLTFEAPITEISLGNLHVEESAEIYCLFEDPDFHLSSDDFLKLIEITEPNTDSFLIDTLPTTLSIIKV